MLIACFAKSASVMAFLKKKKIPADKVHITVPEWVGKNVHVLMSSNKGR